MKAFTLLEGLVSIAIIGILASLAFGSIIAAKQKANRVICVNNLRNHSIVLSEFVSANGEYPLLFNAAYRDGGYTHHRGNWMAALYHGSGVKLAQNEGVFDCPSAVEPKALMEGATWREVYMHYGYNGDGIIGSLADIPLGLGGKGTEDGHAPPVKQAEVINPSRMVAVGDSFWGWNGRINEGAAKIGRGIGALNYPDRTKRAHARHRGLMNVVMCDGHVEAFSLYDMFESTRENALSIWNRDGLPHAERVRN